MAGRNEQVSGAVKNLYDYELTPKMIVARIDNYEFGYVTLGRVYEENGTLQPAKEAFQKASDLAIAAAEPQVKWIQSFLDRINQKIKNAEKQRD